MTTAVLSKKFEIYPEDVEISLVRKNSDSFGLYLEMKTIDGRTLQVRTEQKNYLLNSESLEAVAVALFAELSKQLNQYGIIPSKEYVPCIEQLLQEYREKVFHK
jgi:hypothetical protein